MKHIKNLGLIIGFLSIILALVLLRTSNKNLFKQDSKNAIEAAENGDNSISLEELKNNNSEFLVLDLSAENNSNSTQFQNSIHIPFETLLNKDSQKVLKETKSKIVLYSSDISNASKAWVILNQLGYTTVFILQKEENEEVLKYKFQPVTSDKLE